MINKYVYGTVLGYSLVLNIFCLHSLIELHTGYKIQLEKKISQLDTAARSYFFKDEQKWNSVREYRNELEQSVNIVKSYEQRLLALEYAVFSDEEK